MTQCLSCQNSHFPLPLETTCNFYTCSRQCLIITTLVLLRLNYGSFKLLDDKAFSTISNWHYYAIREMVHLEDFNSNPDWIAKKLCFKVTLLQIKKAVDDLIKLDLLCFDEAGKLKVSWGKFSTPDDVAPVALKRFHEQSIQNSKDAVRTVDISQRYLSGVTLTVKQENLDKMKAFIRKFEDQLIEIIKTIGGVDSVLFDTKNPILQIFSLRTKYEKRCKE